MDANSSHACVLLEDGGVRCWGQDGDGQLGIGTTARRYTPAPVVDAVRHELILNYGWGSVGSQFTLTGFGFTPNGSVRIGANDTQLVGSLPVNASGSFITVLDTSTADEGYYLIAADSVLAAAAQMALSTVSLMLDNNSPLRPQEGGGAPLSQIPAGIAVDPHLLYLPLQMK